MTKGKRIWLYIMAAVLVLAAVGIVSEIIGNGMTLMNAASICVWFVISGYWLNDLRSIRSSVDVNKSE